MAQESSLLIQGIGDVTIINFTTPSMLDSAEITRMADEMYALVEKQAKRKIILDFSTIKFLASQSIGVMLSLQKKLKAIKGKVVFCGLKPEVKKLFVLTGLEKVFEFYPDEEHALTAF